MRAAIPWSLLCCLGIALPIDGMQVQPSSSATPTPPGIERPNLVTRPNNSGPALVNGRSPGVVAEVQKMVDGGADPEVIKAYVKNWTALFWLSADDILRLNDHGTPNDVIIAMIQRSAELRAQALAAAAAPRTTSLVTTNVLTSPAPVVSYPQMAQPTVPVYSYPATYPAYTYSYLYPSWSWPSYSYRSWWSAPYSYSFGYYSWPSYRQHGWSHRPWHGQRYGYHQPVYAGYRPGHGHGGPRYNYVGHRSGGAWSPATGGFRGGMPGHRPGRR